MSAPPPPPTDAGAPPQAGPPPSQPPPTRRLTRLRQGRLLGGVAAGIAAHLGIDPVLARIGFVILGFVPFPGFGVLLYLALVVLLPTDDGDEVAPAPVRERGAAFYVGIGLVALGASWVVSTTTGGRELFPLVLIGIGVALWVDADRRGAVGSTASAGPHAEVPPVAPAAGGAASAPAWQEPPASAAADPTTPIDATAPIDPTTRIWTPPAPAAAPPAGPVWREPTGGGGDRPGGGRPAPVWQDPPREPRQRSPLGLVTFGLALLTAGTVWLLGQLDVLAPSLTDILASALVVLGAGLLVGAVVGRARWLALLAVPLAGVTLAAALADGLGIPVHGPYGDRTVTVTSLEQLDGSFELGAGRLVVDLEDLDVPDGVTPQVRASLGFGDLVVRLPEGAGLTGTAEVQGGEAFVGGTRRGGLAVRHDADVAATGDAPTFDLDLSLGFGQLEVHGPDDTVFGGRGTTSDLGAPAGPLASVAAAPAARSTLDLEVRR